MDIRRTGIRLALLGLVCLISLSEIQAQQIKPGYGLDARRDSVATGIIRTTIFKIDSANALVREYIKRIADSVAANRAGGGGLDADSARRVATKYLVTARWVSILNNDTSETRYFGDFSDYAASAPLRNYVSLIAHESLIPIAITITHGYTDSGTRRARDTTYYYTELDSLTRGQGLWVYYDPAFGGLIAGGYQKIKLAKTAQHAVAETDLATRPVQVPLILKPGTGQVGWLPDHYMQVTIVLVPKVPGRKYW